MKLHRSLLFLLLIATSCIDARFIKITRIGQLAEQVSELGQAIKMVVCDLDNTLVRTARHAGDPTGLQGSYEQFCHMLVKAIREGIDIPGQFLPTYFNIQRSIWLEPLEGQDTIDAFEAWRSCGCRIMGLTARSLDIADRTDTQVVRAGLIFCKDTPYEHIRLRMDNPCIYEHGIVFCGNNDKGEALFAYFDSIGYTGAFVFIDDTEKNLHMVARAAERRGRDCVCLHYQGAQEIVEAMDPSEAERLWFEFQETAYQYNNA